MVAPVRVCVCLVCHIRGLKVITSFIIVFPRDIRQHDRLAVTPTVKCRHWRVHRTSKYSCCMSVAAGRACNVPCVTPVPYNCTIQLHHTLRRTFVGGFECKSGSRFDSSSTQSNAPIYDDVRVHGAGNSTERSSSSGAVSNTRVQFYPISYPYRLNARSTGTRCRTGKTVPALERHEGPGVHPATALHRTAAGRY